MQLESRIAVNTRHYTPSHLRTPHNSSPPPIPLPIADAEESMIGRERLVRKNINYAEPKLNTCFFLSILQLTSYLTIDLYRKMRKLHPVTQAKQSSLEAYM